MPRSVGAGRASLRLGKAAVAIRSALSNPDIIGVQEVENLATLNDLAAVSEDEYGSLIADRIVGAG